MHRHSSATYYSNSTVDNNSLATANIDNASQFQQFYDTEELVRLENTRRACKARLSLIDSMMNEVDDQLMYVSQFKYVWLKYKKELEEQRQALMREECNCRESDVEEAEAKEWRQIILKGVVFEHSV